MNSEEFSSKTPCEIVPILVERGDYLGSESTFYKVLIEKSMLAHTGCSRKLRKHPISTHKAGASNQVWMWDITYLNGLKKGQYYYLYFLLDLYSKKVDWEVWENEITEPTRELTNPTYLSGKQMYMKKETLVLYFDNGSPMKGAAMLETVNNLRITPLRSRPRVSSDNLYVESLFKTLKYVPDYQSRGFETITAPSLRIKKFVVWYNNGYRYCEINYITPAERHSGKDKETL